MFSMMRFPWYRWLRCLGGSRSFKKVNEYPKPTTYVILKGQQVGKVVEALSEMGFVEEWAASDLPRNRFGI